MTTLLQDHLIECEKLGRDCATAKHNRDESTAQFLYRHYNKIVSLYTGAERQQISAAYETAYKLESQSYNPRPLYFR